MAGSIGNIGNIGNFVPYADMLSAANTIQSVPVTLSSSGATDTISASTIVGGNYIRLGATAAVTITTDTAAAIITALNARVGQTFTFVVTNKNTGAGAITIAGGTGVTMSGNVLVPIGYTHYLVGTVLTATTIGLAHTGSCPLQTTATTRFTSVSGGNGTAAAGSLEGGMFTVYATSGATALTTRTAAETVAQAGLATGQSYLLRIFNTNGSTLTITGGTGVTITGTATIATNIFRDYIVTVASGTAVGWQNIGAGDAN